MNEYGIKSNGVRWVIAMLGNTNKVNAQYYGIQVATCGTLTYIRNYKCASSLFYKSLVQLYGWREISYNDISWSGKVFSHIRQPLDRRHRGLAHWLLYNSKMKTTDYNSISHIIKQVSFLDNHSASYTDTFGDDCYKIDWIPVDIFDHNKVIDLTRTLLLSHGQHTLKGFNKEYSNESLYEEKQLYLKIKKEFDDAWTEPFVENPNYSIYRYFMKDIDLYNDVIKNFNPIAVDWKHISWLQGEKHD